MRERENPKVAFILMMLEEGVCLECGGVSLVMVIVTKGSKGGTLYGGKGGERRGWMGGQISGNISPLLLICFMVIDTPGGNENMVQEDLLQFCPISVWLITPFSSF